MRFVITLLVLITLSLKAQNPYVTLAYDSLVIYDFGNLAETESNVKKKMLTYSLDAEPAKKVKLSSAEAIEFSNRIGLKSSYGQSAAACFMPHFTALYYKRGLGVAYVEICVDCNQLDASLKLKAQEYDPQKGDYGMSKAFRKYLKGLLLKYHFSHVPDGKTGMD